MTENEAIERLKCMRLFMEISDKQNENKFLEDDYIANKIAIQALEEIQQYRAIGSIEEFKRAKEMEAVYGQVKWERDIAISQLEEIGVALGQKMEEFKALKEKATPKKLEIEKFWGYDDLMCPNCKSYKIRNPKYCCDCGQALDWQ